MFSLFGKTVKCSECGLYDTENKMTAIEGKGIYHTQLWDSPKGYSKSCYEKAKDEK